MQSQTPLTPDKCARPGLPRRLLTDRTYLKDQDTAQASFSKERVLNPAEARTEVTLQSDTIIQKTQVDEVTR